MIGSRRTLLTAFVGLAAATVTAPVFARDANIPLQLADARRVAPNFVGISKWFNSAPLSISDLRGKVVLVDFWTYDCYNCVNTLPYVTKLYETYKDKGLVVVGIHTPEFPFERSAGSVQAALKRHGITYPVAQTTICNLERLAQSILAGPIYSGPTWSDRLQPRRRRRISRDRAHGPTPAGCDKLKASAGNAEKTQASRPDTVGDFAYVVTDQVPETAPRRVREPFCVAIE